MARGDGCWFCMNGRAKKRVMRERDAERDMKQQLQEEDEPIGLVGADLNPAGRESAGLRVLRLPHVQEVESG